LEELSSFTIEVGISLVVVYVEVGMGFDGREYSQLARIIGSNECSTHLSGNRDLNIPKISTLWIYILMKYLLKVKQVN